MCCNVHYLILTVWIGKVTPESAFQAGCNRPKYPSHSSSQSTTMLQYENLEGQPVHRNVSMNLQHKEYSYAKLSSVSKIFFKIGISYPTWLAHGLTHFYSTGSTKQSDRRPADTAANVDTQSVTVRQWWHRWKGNEWDDADTFRDVQYEQFLWTGTFSRIHSEETTETNVAAICPVLQEQL